jgi:hypothetical protein
MIKWWLGRPDRVAEWAGSSFASAMALVGAWWLVAVALWVLVLHHEIGATEGNLLWNLAYLAAAGSHGILWWQVLRGVWALYRDAAAGPGWLLAVAVLWWVVLLLFQLLSLLPLQALHFPAGMRGTP